MKLAACLLCFYPIFVAIVVYPTESSLVEKVIANVFFVVCEIAFIDLLRMSWEN